MTNPESGSLVSWLAALPPKEQAAAIAEMEDDDAKALLEDWNEWARPEQRAPRGDWRIWLFLGGRGAGKTRAGAEWIAQGIREGRVQRVGLIGATYHETRAIMIEGESGLLAASPAARFEPSLRRLRWPNGAFAFVLSADEPDSIRGHQFDRLWIDEFCKWPAPQEALDMAMLANRLEPPNGGVPRTLITTTPRNIAALKGVMRAPGTAMTVSKTRDNAANLAEGVFAALEARFGGTSLGRQELDAELIEDNENALWHRDWIERARIPLAARPAFAEVVIGVDPSASLAGAECGLVVAAKGENGEGYVLADLSLSGPPHLWAARVAEAYDAFGCDCVVAEANMGGEMVREVLLRAHPRLALKLVHASRDKRTRATPAALLYQQGQVHHVGAFAELEDQMTQYDGTGPSPDRMDALVWALAHLFPLARAAEPKVRTVI